MGGSVNDVVEDIKPRSVEGVDMETLGKGGAHVTRELNKTIGQEGLGGTLSRGMQTINEGITHNIGEIGKVGHSLGRFLTGAGPEQPKDQGAQSAVGRYSTSSQARGKSGKSGAKGSQLKTRENRKITGKGKLYVRK